MKKLLTFIIIIIIFIKIIKNNYLNDFEYEIILESKNKSYNISYIILSDEEFILFKMNETEYNIFQRIDPKSERIKFNIEYKKNFIKEIKLNETLIDKNNYLIILNPKNRKLYFNFEILEIRELKEKILKKNEFFDLSKEFLFQYENCFNYNITTITTKNNNKISL
jgi:hypothetical protein